ncbi:hypothetical protein NL676_008974 [Syzygium grande]|nr:hypothetical protein NL676_008974 [Syzygium grande]
MIPISFGSNPIEFNQKQNNRKPKGNSYNNVALSEPLHQRFQSSNLMSKNSNQGNKPQILSGERKPSIPSGSRNLTIPANDYQTRARRRSSSPADTHLLENPPKASGRSSSSSSKEEDKTLAVTSSLYAWVETATERGRRREKQGKPNLRKPAKRRTDERLPNRSCEDRRRRRSRRTEAMIDRSKETKLCFVTRRKFAWPPSSSSSKEYTRKAKARSPHAG